jgi:hypothetical protein
VIFTTIVLLVYHKDILQSCEAQQKWQNLSKQAESGFVLSLLHDFRLEMETCNPISAKTVKIFGTIQKLPDPNMTLKD